MASAVVGTVACLVAECAEGGPAGLAGPAADLCMRFLDKRPRAQPTGAAEVAACGMRSTDRRPLRAGPQLLRLLRPTGAVGDCVRLGRSGPATAVWIALALQGVRAQPTKHNERSRSKSVAAFSTRPAQRSAIWPRSCCRYARPDTAVLAIENTGGKLTPQPAAR